MPSPRVHCRAIALLVGAAVLAALLIWEPWNTVVAGQPAWRTSILAANSLLLVLGASAIAIPLGTLLATFLFRTDLPGRHAGLVLLASMLFMPMYVHAAAWQAGFGIQGWFPLVTWLPRDVVPWFTAISIHGLAATPWVVLFFGLGLRLVERQLEEDALLTARPLSVFFAVTLRRSWGWLAVAFLWIAITTSGETTITDLFRVRTYAEEVFTNFTVPTMQTTPLGKLILPGVILIALAITAALVLIGQLLPAVSLSRNLPTHVYRLGAWRWPAILAVVGLLLLIVGLPIVCLAYESGRSTIASLDGPLSSWSITQVISRLTSSGFDFRDYLVISYVQSTVACFIATAIASVAAWSVARSKHWSWTLYLTAAVLLAIPGPVLGVIGISVFSRWDYIYSDTLIPPIAALTLRTLPLSLLIFWLAFRSLPPAILESAQIDRIGSWRTFLWVAIPLRLTAMSASLLVCFIVSWGDLSASHLLAPPGMESLTTFVFRRLHSNGEGDVAAICLAILLAIILGTAVTYAAGRWQKSRQTRT